VRFARSGDVDVAYRAVGDGPIDLVYAQGAATHHEVDWELPAFRRYCERLAEFSRLILFDKRGMGMSERVPGPQPWKSAWTTFGPSWMPPAVSGPP
jgi:pimeloyl-ACP methyl ester carboxylesterase